MQIIPINQNQINKYNFSFRKTDKTNGQNILEKTPKKDSFEITIGYINDLHGQTNNMMRILSGMKGDLIVSGGDNYIGDEKNRAVHDATVKFLNLIGLRGTALGNHEMDTKQGDLKTSAEKMNGSIFALNLEQTPLEEQTTEEIEKFNKTDLKEFIKKSDIIEINGEKIGLLGTTPVDLSNRATHPDYHRDCKAFDLNKTTELVQKEVDNLRSRGVNKIVMLSHLGIERDKEVAKNTEGIDVIIGGHTHELLEGIKEGENLLYSKNGEPVVITEAGKDGKHFGNLNLKFDKDGVITKAQNNLADTSLYHRNLVHQYIFNQILGKPEIVGEIEEALPPAKSLLEENPHANFMCDAMREEMDADIAVWNNAATRNFFKKGIIDSSDIKEIAPFADNISVAEVSEKTIVDAFRKATEISYSSIGNKPGLLAVSGLNYTVSPTKKTLVEMNFVDKNGVEHPIDINNPREDKKYKVVADSFIMSWGADYDVLSPKDKCTEYPFTKADLTCEYIKHMNKPVVVNQVGRIKYSD